MAEQEGQPLIGASLAETRCRLTKEQCRLSELESEIQLGDPTSVAMSKAKKRN